MTETTDRPDQLSAGQQGSPALSLMDYDQLGTLQGRSIGIDANALFSQGLHRTGPDEIIEYRTVPSSASAYEPCLPETSTDIAQSSAEKLMNWYLEVLRKYAVFNGRSRRKEYWFYFLFNFLIITALLLIDNMIGTFDQESGMGLLSGLYAVAVLIPGIAVAVRRLHDTNRTGWWVLIALIPIVGPILLIFFLIQDSTEGNNRFGSNPKEVGVQA